MGSNGWDSISAKGYGRSNLCPCFRIGRLRKVAGLLTGKVRRRGASTAAARRKLAGTALQSSKSTRITRGRERGSRRNSPEHSRATGRRGDGGRRRSEAAEVARRGGRWCAVGAARSHVK